MSLLPCSSSIFRHQKPSPPPHTMPPPPALPDDLFLIQLPNELLEEIFLRLPPDEPEHLLRASLASKFWLDLLSGARFRGRYHEHHRAPPILGFLHAWPDGSYDPEEEEDNAQPFVPTTKFIPDDDSFAWAGAYWSYSAWDCRHGRVLLTDDVYRPTSFLVWDPMTGCARDAPCLVVRHLHSFGAAVLCAVTGCDHRTCHAGPFKVVFVGVRSDDCVAQACVSFPVTMGLNPFSHLFGSEPSSGLHLEYGACIYQMHPVLVEDALHFKLYNYFDDDSLEILKYDMSTNCLSLIDMPLAVSVTAEDAILMKMEDGGLGFAHVDGSMLNLWSRQMGSDGVASWTRRSVINIDNILLIQNPKEIHRLIGSVEGTDIIFVTTDLGIYKINLKSLKWKKLCERREYCALIPYMSFYHLPERKVAERDER